MTIQRALELKSQGKAVNSPIKTRSTRAIKELRQAPSSRFQQVMLAKEAQTAAMKKAPAKMTPQGDNIYGYLGYNTENMAFGLYEFNEHSQDLIWEDPVYAETELTPANLSLQNGVLKGYIVDIFWGMLFGVYYVEYDFETGEPKAFVADESGELTFMQSAALDTNEGVFYGYGAYEGEYGLLSAPADDPFNYTLVTASDDFCTAMCYNAADDALYGVNDKYEFVSIDKLSGEQTPLATLDVDGGATYLTGMCYDPVSNLYYWNINTLDDRSYLATIDGGSYALNVFQELFASEEYMALVTTDDKINPDQPKRPEAGAADFYKDNLIGFVSFTMPSQMADGTEISGKVDYLTFVDGNLYSTGTAEAGEEVKANFAVEPGLHIFGMKAVVNGVESSMTNVRAYVGNDTPLMPENVRITDNEISWNAVGSVGVHGGYVDAAAVEYDVFLNGEFIARTMETSQAINIDKEADLQTYNATVVAVCNGYESEAGSSNTIVEGAALALPLYIEPTPEQFAISTVLDGNEDGKSWTLVEYTEDGDYCIDSGWNATEVSDEWYFLPPFVVEDVTKFYTFSMDAALRSTQYTDEYVEVLLCNEPSKSGVVDEIIPEFSPISSAFEQARGEFRVRQAGTYYVAIHATSEPDMYGIRACNFAIEDNNITLESPEAVSDIELEAAAEGKLEATATITLPSMTLGGAEIPADAKLVANLSCGENKITLEGAPGEEVSGVIATAQGDNIVSVTVALGDLNSPMASETVYTGVTVPATVASLTAELSDDHCSITLSWPAVTEPFDEDGYVDPETIVYDIYKVIPTIFGNQWSLYEPGVEETTYTYTSDYQDFVQLGVVSRNAAGDNGYLMSITAVVGPSYELPIYEDFDDPEVAFNTEPWVIGSSEDAPSAQFGLYYTNSLSEAYAGSETIVLAVKGEEGAYGELSTPVFKTTGLESAAITLDVCGDFFLPNVTIAAEAEGIEAEEIGTVTMDELGFHKVSVVLPEKFMGKEFVRLSIRCEFETGNEVLAIESIEIGSSTGVASIATSGVKIAAGKNVINVSGLNGQNVTVSTLDGRVAAKAEKVGKDASFNVESGIYVVNAGGKKAKVVVR